MRKQKLHIAILLWVVATPCLFAQNAKLKRAEKAMMALDYPTAIEIYQDILEKDDNLTAKIKLAEAYRKTNQYSKAEDLYAKVVSIPDIEPNLYFYYGLMLQRNNKCEQAQLWYNRFLKLKPYDYRKQHLQRACEYQQELMNKQSQVFAVELPVFNSAYDDLGPAFYQDGLVFGSLNLRERSNAKSTEAFFDLYYVESEAQKQGNTLSLSYGAVERFSANLNTRVHEAIVTFNENETEIFFTRNQKVKGNDPEELVRLEIMSARRLENDQWSDLKPLSFNSEEYSVAHPALSPDGRRLYFSSDMPGGFGGKDLYLSFRESDRWGPPINLGPTINTEGDELFPFYHADGYLYFASDGHFGLGGQDVYRIEDLTNGDWGTVENLGFPINTPHDDFGLILSQSGDFGYFTSNREGGMGGDDIYSFRKKSLALATRVFVVDAATGKGIAGANIKTSCGLPDQQTGPDGQLAMNINVDNCCTLFCSMLDYFPQTLPVCNSDWEGRDTALVYIALERAVPSPAEAPPVKEEPFVISGTIYDETSGLPIEGATVKLLGENCQLPLPIQTDATGEYAFELMDDCCYQLRVEKGNYFSRTIDANICPDKKLTTREFLKDVSLQPYLLTINERTYDKKSNILPPKLEGEAAESFEISTPSAKDDDGVPAFKLNLYYESGRSSVKKESVDELKRLLQLLRDNPKVILEIRSHTDSNGSASYNNRLSQKRADNIVRWLTQMGIESNRLIPKGYGESRLVNDCDDDTPCPDSQHQMNRRTEFKVLGTVE